MNIEEIKNLKTFEERYNYDVSKYIEIKKVEGVSKKTGRQFSYELKYLSWAYAQKIARIVDPKFKWIAVPDENENLNRNGFVLIEMTFLDETQQHYFPILDASNNAIRTPNAFDINTAQMRGMAKLFAMLSGFGLSLYTGEDIRDIDNTGTQAKPKKELSEKEQKAQGIEYINKNSKEFQKEIDKYLSDYSTNSLDNIPVEKLKELCTFIRETKKQKKGA